MRQKTDPVNIIIAVIAIMVIAGTWLLMHRIFQSVHPAEPPKSEYAPVR